MLSELGASVVDADRVARDVVAAGTPGLEAVVAAFGTGVLTPGGALDRAELASVVFDDAAALADLNAIVHPLVRAETAARVARMPDGGVVVHDVPLIVEEDMGASYQLVVVVGASEAIRTERAVARGLTRAQAIARIAAQADDRARRRAADVWVANEGTEETLREVVELLWHARVVPFSENLRNGMWAEPGEPTSSATTEVARAEQAARLVARLDRSAGGRLTPVRYQTPLEEPALDLLELRAAATDGELGSDCLLGAGFVAVREGVFGNADPGRPAALRLTAED